MNAFRDGISGGGGLSLPPEMIGETTVTQWFEAVAESYASRPAVKFEDLVLTYAELNARANQVAHGLRSAGLKKGDPVAIWMERSEKIIIAILGIQKAGAVYVPLDVHHPTTRNAFILQDSGCKAVLGEGPCPSEFSELPYYPLNSWSGESTSNPETALVPGDTLYILYTSGSTGTPKGCLLSHRNIVRFLNNGGAFYDFNEHDVWMVINSFCFDVSVWEMYGALFSGGTLIVVPQEEIYDFAKLVDRCIRERVTILNRAPAAFFPLAREALKTGHDFAEHLRYIIFAGDKLQFPQLSDWVERFPLSSIPLVNMYGITECTVYSTIYWLKPEDISPRATESIIGKPLPETEIFVLDEALQPCPASVPGELFIGGTGLSSGYLNRPDLTREKFIENPLPGPDRLYRTGDLGYWKEDGNLVFLGRNDHQVQWHGQRIEPGEIENEINRSPEVKESVVVSREDDSGNQHLIAYLTGQPGQSIDIEAIRDRLERRLPSGMIPNRWMVLDQFPLNVNGKIDRPQLPGPEAIQNLSGSRQEAPKTPIEQEIARIWQASLRVKTISRWDTFNALGGQSLLAVMSHATVCEQLKCAIPLKVLMERATLKDYAAAFEARLDQKTEERPEPASVLSSIKSTPPSDIEQDYPLSPFQEDLLIHQSLDPESSLYVVPLVYRITGSVDRRRLEESIRSLIRVQEELRTRIWENRGDPFHRVENEESWSLDYQDLSSGLAADREQACQEWMDNFLNKPLNLEQDFPVQSCLIQLDKEDFYWVTKFHHLVTDEWALDIFTQEVGKRYGEDNTDQTPPGEEPETQYRDFIRWHAEWRQSRDYQDKVQWWRRTLEASPRDKLNLFQGQPGSDPFHPFRGATLHHDLTSITGSDLRRFSEDQDMTPFQVLLGAFSILTHRYSGLTDFVLGIPASLRTDPNTHRVIGLFLNTLPLRIRIEENSAALSVLRAVRQNLSEAFARAEVPYGEILKRVRSDSEKRPLVNTLFVQLPDDQSEDRHYGALRLRPVPASTRTAKFDLTIFVQVGKEKITTRVEYSELAYSEDQARQCMEDYEALIAALIKQPEAALDNLTFPSLFPPKALPEKQHPEVAESLTGLLEPGFQSKSSHTALHFQGAEMTYATLDSQTRKIAGALLDQRPDPDTPVGLYMPRSENLVMGMLGILRGGLGYLPLDTRYPESRIQKVIQRGNIQIVLVSRGLPILPVFQNLRLLYIEDILESAHPLESLPETSEDQLAYVLFTSGTSGEPQGIKMHRRPLANLIQWQVQQSEPEPRTTQFASIGFDVSFQEIFSTLAAGGTLHLIDEATSYDVSKFWERVRKAEVSRIFIPVVILRELCRHFQSQPQSADRLREVIVAGEQLVIDDAVRFFFQSHPRTKLVNQYGPTEAHVVSQYMLEGEPAHWPDFPPIGFPIPGAEIYILGPHGKPVPRGVRGQIAISGLPLSQGYWNNADRTADRFTSLPLGGDSKTKAYLTGDRGRILPNGCIEFLGRLDNQVKIRGFRIELEDVERNLAECPAVHHCAVDRVHHPSTGEQLVAYIESTRGSEDEAAIWKHLQNVLPDYMIPASLLFVQKMPRNANGKIDRDALRADHPEKDTPTTVQTANLLERKLLQILNKLFERESIQPTDDFFKMGGYSLLAVRYLYSIQEELGLDVALNDLFQYPTVRELANRVQSKASHQSYRSLVPIAPGGDRKPLYFVHGWGGEVFVFLELANMLGEDQPVYGLQAIEFSNSGTPFQNVESAAAHYLDEIKRFQPEGPYQLSGYSLGGMIAYEMARQLIEQGDEVSFLGIIDTYPKNLPLSIHYRAALPYLAYRTRFHLQRIWSSGAGNLPAYLRGRLQALKFILGMGGRKKRAPDGNVKKTDQEENIDLYLRLYNHYLPVPCPVNATLFKASETRFRIDLAWRYLAQKGIRVVPLEGDHSDFFKGEKQLKFARIFKAELERTQSQDPSRKE